MTRVLLVDDAPGDRAYLKELAPPDWEWIEAEDFQSGVLAFHQAWPNLDLVVIDICLPDRKGQWICARIRDVSTTVPILPFTAKGEELAAIEEFGCLPPLKKPVRPAYGRRVLEHLAELTVKSARPSPLALWVAGESTDLTPAIAALQRQKVVIYARNRVMRRGLVGMFTPQERISEAESDLSLRNALVAPGITVLVADGDDYAEVRTRAQEYGIPLVLVARTLEQLQVLQSSKIKAVLLGSDPIIEWRLRGVVRALGAGEPITPFLDLSDEPRALVGEIVPPEMLERFADTDLSEREKEVLWLISGGLNRAQIAGRLGIAANTVKSHVQHAQEALNVDRPGLDKWLRERFGQKIGAVK